MHRIIIAAAALVLALLPKQALTDVVYATTDGFYIEITRDVTAPPETAYAQFLRVGEWWNGEHTWFGNAGNMLIEPRAGGCFCERDGDRSAFHMLVSYVNPGRAMHMVGGLGPLQGLGLHGAMQWLFDPRDQGGTRITHRYRVTGYYPEGLEALAAVVDRVQADQVTRLQARLNGATY